MGCRVFFMVVLLLVRVVPVGSFGRELGGAVAGE
jgi:hypothetical protein